MMLSGRVAVVVRFKSKVMIGSLFSCGIILFKRELLGGSFAN